MARGRHDYEKKVISVESEGYQDLHGRIMMQDDFEDAPFKWNTQGAGVWAAGRQAAAAYNGGYGAQLTVTSTAPPISHYAAIFRYVPIDVTRRLQAEIFWRADDLSRLDRLELWLDYYDGTILHEVALQYDCPNTRWQYYDELGGMLYLPGSDQTFRNNGWNELTLSADFATDKYIRMKSNNIDINMGNITCRHPGDPTSAHTRIAIVAGNTTANQLIVSIDDAVLKELEN